MHPAQQIHNPTGRQARSPIGLCQRPRCLRDEGRQAGIGIEVGDKWQGIACGLLSLAVVQWGI